VPPLRERQNEIVPLVRRFIAEFAERFERDVRGLAPDAEQALIAYEWPGNVRELRNRVERAVALAESRWIGPSDLFPDSDAPPVPATEKDVPTLAEVRADAERRHIMAVLGKTEGQIAEAANLLGISRTTALGKDAAAWRLGCRSEKRA
jgi:two-component system, NtrC family, response regulator HydG